MNKAITIVAIPVSLLICTLLNLQVDPNPQPAGLRLLVRRVGSSMGAEGAGCVAQRSCAHAAGFV